MTEEIKPKKRVNSKSKGSGNEGAIAKLLSASLAPLNFVRSPGSGARVGGQNFEKFGKMFGVDALKIFVGDVVCLNERDHGLEFKFSVEAKFYKTSDNFSSLFTGKANVYKWFEESVVDAVKTDKHPILICKWNNTPQFAVLGKDIEIPAGINTIVLINGIQVCYLADLLQHRDFWVHKTI